MAKLESSGLESPLHVQTNTLVVQELIKHRRLKCDSAKTVQQLFEGGIDPKEQEEGPSYQNRKDRTSQRSTTQYHHSDELVENNITPELNDGEEETEYVPFHHSAEE